MSMTISTRLQPLSGREGAGQRRHDLRDPNHVPSYVDKSRTHENSVILEAPDVTDIRNEIAKNRQEHGQQKLRADARTTISGIITFGTDAQHVVNGMTKEEQDEMFFRIAKRVEHETGHQLLGLVVHRDESAVHAHYTLRGYAIDKNGKEQAWRKSPADLKKLQDIAGEEVESLGISRGKAKEQRIIAGEDRSKTVHRSVRQLHEDLPKEVQQKEAHIKDVLRKAKRVAALLKPLEPEPLQVHKVEYIKRRGSFLKQQETALWSAVSAKDVERDHTAWKRYAAEVRISASSEALQREVAVTEREKTLALQEKLQIQYKRAAAQFLHEHPMPSAPEHCVYCSKDESLEQRLDVLTGKRPALGANDHGHRIDGDDLKRSIEIATSRQWQGPIQIDGDDAWKRKAGKAFLQAGFQVDAETFPRGERGIADLKTEIRREAYRAKRVDRGHGRDGGHGL